MVFRLTLIQASGIPTMSFFISDVIAAGETAAQTQEPGLGFMAIMMIIFFTFFMLFIRPQTKRAKEQKKMLEALSKGTEVVTNGGMLGKVVDLDDNFVQLDLGNNVIIQVQRHAIQNTMPKGTFKVQSKKLKNS